MNISLFVFLNIYNQSIQNLYEFITSYHQNIPSHLRTSPALFPWRSEVKSAETTGGSGTLASSEAPEMLLGLVFNNQMLQQKWGNWSSWMQLGIGFYSKRVFHVFIQNSWALHFFIQNIWPLRWRKAAAEQGDGSLLIAEDRQVGATWRAKIRPTGLMNVIRKRKYIKQKKKNGSENIDISG